MIWKRIIASAFSLCLISGTIPLTINTTPEINITYALEAQNGTCGDNVIWNYDGNGTLKISGTGKMSTSSLNIPWEDYQTAITSIVIENGVTNISDFAFRSCSKLTSISIGNTVTSIGKNAFKDCTNLTDITFPNKLISIEKNAFYNCIGFKSIIFPNSLTSIGESAFENCTSLTSAVIPDKVQNIGDYAFNNCSNELVIHCSFGSAAFSYAKANKINYDDSYIFEDDPEIPEPTNSSDEPKIPDTTKEPEESGETDEPNNSDIFYISSAKDLSIFKELYKADSSYLSKDIILKSNIKVPDEWESIPEYSGTFNGNGHSISGLTESLFTTLTETATVKNLTLSDVDIKVSTGGDPVGGLTNRNYGKIENCSVSGEVRCITTYTVTSIITWLPTSVFPDTFKYFCVGGIAGLNCGEISDCENTAKVNAINTSDKEIDSGIYYAASGGISGENSGRILRCTNSGNVSANVATYSVPAFTGTSYQNFRSGYTAAVSGGICGFTKGEITQCTSTGAYATNSNRYNGRNDEETAWMLNAEAFAYTGGICGAVSNATISRCSVSEKEDINGNVTANVILQGGDYVNIRRGHGYSGGIAGLTNGKVYINECSNKIDTCVTFTTFYDMQEISKDFYCGGILGATNGDTTISNCYNWGSPSIDIQYLSHTGQSKGSGVAHHGGIIGASRNVTIENPTPGNHSFTNYSGSAHLVNCYTVAYAVNWNNYEKQPIYDDAISNESTARSNYNANTNISVENCYYLSTLTSKSGTAKTEEEMKSKDFAETLGSPFVYETDSYPIFTWEKEVIGDVNADGQLTIADAVMMQNWLHGAGALTDWKAGDLCKDNRIDIFDFVLLRKALLQR